MYKTILFNDLLKSIIGNLLNKVMHKKLLATLSNLNQLFLLRVVFVNVTF